MALKGDLLGSAAIYRIEKNNIANIEYDFGVRSINTDAIQEVYGIDADMTYQLNTINLI